LVGQIAYEKVLNPAQLEAVMTLEGPVLVIAGAGSGKTRTLVYRVARLVEVGIPPESILLLTFTRKAAQEMLERAAHLSDRRCRFASGGTFHSLALRVLRAHAGRLGFPVGFTILDRSDMEEVLRVLIPELQLPKGIPRFPKKGTLANILSKAANLQRPLEDVVAEEYGQFLEFTYEIGKLQGFYRGYKQANHLMDYDDLIINFRKLLEQEEEVRREIGAQYGYVMVDEYQDTNAIQADTVKWLALDHRNVMVVGDDAQAIYSFRGADYRNMFTFPDQFPEAKVIKLQQNYRSTQPILTMTNVLMKGAAEQYTKCLFTGRTGGGPPRIVDTMTEPEQALFICRFIRSQLDLGRPLSDFAVLFRAAYHSFELEAELTRQGLPYVKYGGFKFLESAHIKDFLAHLRVVVNPEEMVSWFRVLRLVENVGQGKSQAIIKWMRDNRIPHERLGEWPGAGKKETGLKPLQALLGKLASKGIKPGKAVERVMDYYVPLLKERFDDYPRRQKELEQLTPMAGRYKKLGSFLDDLVLEPPTSSADMDPSGDKETLILSTVHSAKGLEWPVVFVIWVADGRFPPVRAFNNPLALEEERRLMYVAATRAKDELIMCYPGQEGATAWSHGHSGLRPGRGSGLSCFIQGLPADVVSYEYGGTSSRIRTRGWFDVRREEIRDHAGAPGLSPGDKVKHPAFGPGVVSKFKGGDKVEVLFRNVGRKLLHLEHTTLVKV